MKSRAKSWISADPVVLVAPLLAVTLALAIGGVMILALGKNPIEAYGAMLDGAFGNVPSILRTLTRAVPLMLVAIGICIAFRGGVVNIGAEGQLFVGAISATAFSLASGDSLSSWLFIPLTLLVGFAAGAFWGGVPGFLKAHFRVNEILSTVMMNEIAIQLLLFLLGGPLIDPKEIEQGTRIRQTAQLPEGVWLPRLTDTAKDLAQRLGIPVEIQTSQLHTGIFIAIALAVIVYVLLWRTTVGYRIRAVGQNRDAALYAGISVPTYLLLSLLMSGGLAGIAGAVEVTGLTHRVVEGFAVGYGFSGIVVALFGRLHPLGAIPSAFLFGALLVGAEKMQRSLQIPSATIIGLEGLVVLFVVSSDLWVRRRAARRQVGRAPESQIHIPEAEPAASQVRS
jgi:simple sugar transport system permease protein